MQAGGVYVRSVPATCADLCGVAAGLNENRRSPAEPVVGMNPGIALEDMATAPLVLERARGKQLGVGLPLRASVRIPSRPPQSGV